MDAVFYSSAEWRILREHVLERDGRRCTVSRLLGGECRGDLHVHHLDRHADALDPDNCGTVCAAHHPRWEAVRRAVLRGRPTRRRCTHYHPYAEGRRLCEARLNDPDRRMGPAPATA